MDLYKTLGVERGADAKEIKKAYFNLAKTHHPDKGGDAEVFKGIQRAYDVLGTDESRNFYDQTGQVPGENGAPAQGQGGGMPGGFPFDLGGIFGGMGGMGGMFGGNPFGGGRGAGGPPSARRRGKAPPKVHEINLTLKDFYQGRMFKINFERQKFCDLCHGDGYTSAQTCDSCGGAGNTTVRMMMGPGMMVQTQMPCGPCNGSGRKPGPNCSSCNGKCFVNQEKALDVVIEAGTRPRERIVFTGECSDQQEFAEAGDVHIQLNEADEDIPWKRDGNNLKATLAVNLCDSLLGSTKTIMNHPGFETGCVVTIPPGSIHQTVVVVKGAGMPVKGSGQKGDAHITLLVTVDAAEQAAIVKNHELLRTVLSPSV